MNTKRNAAFAVIAVACLLAGGCDTFSNRYGPDTKLDVSKVTAASTSQSLVMAQFIADSGQSGLPSVNYYPVAVAGFNYVDQVCDTYLVALFKIDKRRDRVVGGLNAGLTVASAALTLENATEYMSLLTTSFGFATAMTNSVAASYVFADQPELIYATVEKMRRKFRANARARATTHFESEPAAYGAVREYLSYCLPPIIEANISGLVASANAVSVDDTNSLSVALQADRTKSVTATSP
jgi:hypothetical protein